MLFRFMGLGKETYFFLRCSDIQECDQLHPVRWGTQGSPAAKVPHSSAHGDQVLPQPTCLTHRSVINEAQQRVVEQQHCPRSERGNSAYAVKMGIADESSGFLRNSAVMSVSFVCLVSYCPATLSPGVRALAHTDTLARTSLYFPPAESRSS